VTTDRLADAETAWIPRAERPEPLPTALAALAGAALTALLYMAAQGGTVVFMSAVLAVQALLVAAWCGSARPPGKAGVAVVAGGTAVLADLVLAFGKDNTVGGLGGVIAAAFGATIVSQLVRGEGRRHVTEAFGSTLTLVVGVVALSTTISLHRQIGGVALLAACLGAAGAGLVVARLTDLLVPSPTMNVAVSRGMVGVLAGSLAGAVVGGVSGALTAHMALPLALLAGWGVALAAVLADIGVGYAAAGRAIVEQRPEPTPWRPVLGPLLGVSVAAPAGYVFSLVLFSL
jgi:hypothetical protein